MVYIIFLISAALVIFSGSRLSVYGDVVATKTGLGHSFVGIALIAFFTSLPELISTIGAVTIVDAPDLAFGNVFGSNMFNILIIFILDAVFRKTEIYKNISLSNWIAGFYAVLLMVAAMFGFQMQFLTIGSMSLVSIAMLVLYLMSSYSIFKSATNEGEEECDSDASLKKAFVMFLVFASIIVVAGLVMSKTADTIAEITGLGRTFIGSFLLAVVTSLPELASCYAAVKIGATNMAIGGLFGSNVFNMTIIFVADAVYVKAPIFGAVSPNHLTSSIFTTMVTVIALLGIREAEKMKLKFLGISAHSYVIFALYVGYTAYMYMVR